MPRPSGGLVHCKARDIETIVVAGEVIYTYDLFSGLIVAEIFRRFIWNFFRVELAHVLEHDQDNEYPSVVTQLQPTYDYASVQ